MTISSYYLWKWADNDLAGRPGEVFYELMRGKMHPALQVFDPEPVAHELRRTLQERLASNEEWSWEICKDESGNQACFIHVSCLLKDNPRFSRDAFLDRFNALGLSGYDEQRGRLIECLSPKLNLFQCEQWWDEPRYDIKADELKVLLRRLDSAKPNPFACLQDRRSNFVQCMACGGRFSVEWHEMLNPANWESIAPWRLETFPVPGKRRHFFPPGVKYRVVKGSDWVDSSTGIRDHESISFGETVEVFRTFLRGEPRPAQYRWRSIRSELEQPKS